MAVELSTFKGSVSEATKELDLTPRRGKQYSRSYVARHMKTEGIRSKLKKKYRVTTDKGC